MLRSSVYCSDKIGKANLLQDCFVNSLQKSASQKKFRKLNNTKENTISALFSIYFIQNCVIEADDNKSPLYFLFLCWDIFQKPRIIATSTYCDKLCSSSSILQLGRRAKHETTGHRLKGAKEFYLDQTIVIRQQAH